MLFLINIVFCFLVFLNLFGCGIILSSVLKINQKSLLQLFISGSVFTLFISILINFFYPLNIYITNSFFIFFILVGIIYFYEKINYSNNLKIFIFVIFFSSIITYKSYPYADYEFYHLPYMEVLRNFKIIFGLANFEFSFGHSAILQNVTVLHYNSLMGLDSYI